MGIKKFGVFFTMAVLGIFWVNHQAIEELASSEKFASRSPQSVTNAKNECDPVALGFGVQNEVRLPPKVIYHYGAPEILAKDVKANQVPIKDWNQYIMGNKTRFVLKPFRRGLYGTDAPEDADKFSSSKYSGLIAIKIKEECLVPSRVSSIVALGTQTRFKDWFEEKERGLSLDSWNKQCFSGDGKPDQSQFQFFENREDASSGAKQKTAIRKISSEQVSPESICEKLVNEFWTDTRMAVVQDYIVSRSWAIRDRKCIEGIDGTSEYWVKVFSENQNLWANSCDPYVTHHARARVWFKALSEKLDSLPAAFSLKDFLKGIKGPETHGVSDFNLHDVAQNFDEALARCRSQQHLDEFKTRMKNLSRDLDGLMSQEIKSFLNDTCK